MAGLKKVYNNLKKKKQPKTNDSKAIFFFNFKL